MKASIRLLLLTIGISALTGCSTTPTTVNQGGIHAQTFNFVKLGAKQPPSGTDNREGIHRLIQSAITKNLEARGVKRVNAGGTITVTYLVITGNRVQTSTIRDYYGYSDDVNALQDKAHAAYGASKNPNLFEAGTLVIDIIDSSSFKLLKRGYASRQILRELSPGARAERIQEVVDEILRDVRITP